jgi:RNA-directed DNA polymerase
LELSESKTHITHINDGFTFLGFGIRRYQGTHGKPVVLIRPSQANIRKFKTKIKELTRRNTTWEPVWYKVMQLNRILRGWSAYYQHVNAKTTFSKLDWWVLDRVFRWARKKHGKPAWRTISAKYRRRDPKGRNNFVCHLNDGSPVWLYRMSDRPIRRYWFSSKRPTYAEGGVTTNTGDHVESMVEPKSYPVKERDQIRAVVLRRDDYMCQRCQATGTRLYVHHIVPRHKGGTDESDNLISLCHQCHCKAHRTVDGRTATSTVKADGEPCAGKLARTVREAA